MNKTDERPTAPQPKNKKHQTKILFSDIKNIPKTYSVQEPCLGAQKVLRTAKFSKNFVRTQKTVAATGSYSLPKTAVQPRRDNTSKWAAAVSVLMVLALAVLLTGPWKLELNSADASSVTFVNGYPTINGSYIDCDGNVDSDMAHHVLNPNDTDPNHHVGQNCPSGSVVALANSVPAATPVAIGNASSGSTQPTAPALVASSSTGANVNVWWPVDGAVVMGTQPFKAVVNNMPLGNYQMFWQVDGGTLNLMSNSQNNGAHKEDQVDISGWTWKGSGPYQVTFVAKDLSGNILATNTSNIYIPAAVGTTQTAAAPLVPTVPAAQQVMSSSDPLAGIQFYRDPNSNSQQWINNNGNQGPNDSLMAKIASQPNAIWLGSWNNDVQSDTANVINAAKSQGQIPVFVVYNIPNRDCGGYSAGGAQTASDYQNWINQVKAGLGNNKVVVIVEPDGAALTTCLSPSELQTRYSLIEYAVQALKGDSNALVYIDAGHPDWIPDADMANRLMQSGINQADGFALNVSNFTATQDNISYGQAISSQVGGKHFIIDTSRNGQGAASDNAWCNPQGRGLGSKPTTNTGNSLIDAFVWAKDPGGSDGTCNGGPAAGVFWPQYALMLARNSIW